MRIINTTHAIILGGRPYDKDNARLMVTPPHCFAVCLLPMKTRDNYKKRPGANVLHKIYDNCHSIVTVSDLLHPRHEMPMATMQCSTSSLYLRATDDTGVY